MVLCSAGGGCKHICSQQKKKKSPLSNTKINCSKLRMTEPQLEKVRPVLPFKMTVGAELRTSESESR